MSGRANEGPDDQVTIGGFVVTGTQNKSVLLRGIGPSLAENGIVNCIQDPTIELFNDRGEQIGANDDWQNDEQAFLIPDALRPGKEAESALYRTVSPGNYTVILRGKGGQTGVGLAEIYDLETATDSSISALANFSVRGVTGAGDDVLINGFIVTASTNAQVVVRGIGPALAQSGVKGALTDPAITLYDAEGNVIEVNDSWKLSPRAEDLVAVGLAPTDDREAAIFASLPAGNYTVICRGTAATTGVALVELYSLGAGNR